MRTFSTCARRRRSLEVPSTSATTGSHHRRRLSGSIGALAVAPSDPDVVYVGSGRVSAALTSLRRRRYKSTDAGRTWQHLGSDNSDLRNAQQIAAIIVDPKNPTASSSALSDILTVPTPSAASSARSMAARPGKRSSIRMMTSAPPASSSIPEIRRSSSPPCGPRVVHHGRPEAATTAPEAVSTNPPMAATPGAKLQRVCPPRLTA